MLGGLGKRPGKAVRDKLLASACVIHDGKETAALVGVDAIAILGKTVAQARKAIEAATKIPGAHVLVGCNHAHAAGPTVTFAGGDENSEYTDQAASAVGDTWQSLHAAEIGVGTDKEGMIPTTADS